MHVPLRSLYLNSLEVSTDGASALDATLRFQFSCLTHLIRTASPSLRTLALAPSLLNRTYKTNLLSDVANVNRGTSATSAAPIRRPHGELLSAHIRIWPASDSSVPAEVGTGAGAANGHNGHNGHDGASAGDSAFDLLAEGGAALHISVECSPDASGVSRCLPNSRAFGEHASMGQAENPSSIVPTFGRRLDYVSSKVLPGTRYLSFGFAHNLTWIVEDE